MKHFLAIDPGGVHQGVAYFSTTSGGLIRHWTRELTRDQLFGFVVNAVESGIEGWVVEEFRLLPELARQQGYSDFPTCEVIGVLQYIADTRMATMVRQGSGMKKRSRDLGSRVGEDKGSLRSISTATKSVWGWDYSARTQHERDATAHGVWYAFRNPESELFEKDHGRKGKLGFLTWG